MVDVTACLQRRLRENRRRVDEVVVVAQAKEGLDPQVLPVPTEEDAVVAVVVEACKSTAGQMNPRRTDNDKTSSYEAIAGPKGRSDDKGWGE